VCKDVEAHCSRLAHRVVAGHPDPAGFQDQQGGVPYQGGHASAAGPGRASTRPAPAVRSIPANALPGPLALRTSMTGSLVVLIPSFLYFVGPRCAGHPALKQHGAGR
jgi:hypothetical protein